MVLLIDECARILNCKVKSLRDSLIHPINRTQLIKSLVGKKARTTYPDRNGLFKTVIIGGFSLEPAACLLAYGQLPRPFNCSVATHYYSRHRIRLQHPYHCCAIEHTGNRNEKRYFPLELLELIEENNDIWPVKFYLNDENNSSTETLVNDDDLDLNSGREQCSQMDDDGW